jgi:hypothetical protein
MAGSGGAYSIFRFLELRHACHKHKLSFSTTARNSIGQGKIRAREQQEGVQTTMILYDLQLQPVDSVPFGFLQNKYFLQTVASGTKATYIENMFLNEYFLRSGRL